MKTFAKQVYTLLSRVPKGYVTTYKALANNVDSRAYRAIGQLMRHNPDAPIVPCHRVVRSDGRIGGYKGTIAGREIRNKIALLQREGVEIKDGKIVNFERVLYKFN